MSLELPDELLFFILERLDGKAVLRCRAVCRRWRDIVDSLPDRIWRRVCYNDRRWYDYPSYYESVRAKNGLSWRDAYVAVNSWANIQSADVRILELCGNVQCIKVLPNNILACLINTDVWSTYGLSNSIVYYNTNTLEESDRIKMDFEFASNHYDENEHYRVFVHWDDVLPVAQLRVMVKANNQLFVIADLMRRNTFSLAFINYTLIGREIYFQNIDDFVCVAEVVEKKQGKLCVETSKICDKPISTNIVKFSCVKGKVFALSDNVDIYMNTYEDWKLLRNAASGWHNFHHLKFRGFDWRYANLFFAKPYVKYTERNLSLKVVSSASENYDSLKLEIICLPNCIYGSAKLLDILTSSPAVKVIDLNSINKKKPNMMQQIDMIETGSKHQIVILYGGKVLLIEISPPNQTTQMTLRSSSKPLYIKCKKKRTRKNIGQYKTK